MSAFRKCRLSVAVTAAVLAAPTAMLANAQNVDDEASEERIVEQVIVTGTRLERTSFETTQPSTSFDQDFILNSGFNNTADAINSLPVMIASGTSLAESDGDNVGQSFADLYGLGTQRTLTLVNGRRTVSGNAPTAFGANAGSQVDLNTLPTSLIERVEVVSIGGAPIYGSDAIAGTINVIMKQDFEGFEVDISSGVAQDNNDAWEHRIGVTAGFNFADGRGNMAIGYEYNTTDAVLANDRDFTRRYFYDFENPNYDPDDPTTGTQFYFSEGRSIPIVTQNGIPGTGPGPVLFAFGVGFFEGPDGRPFGFDQNGRLTGLDIGIPTGNAINFEGGDGLLLQDYDSVRAPIERHLLNVFGHYDIVDNVSAFWELNYYNGKSSDPNAQPFYQSALFGGDSTSLEIPLDNPFLDPADRQLLLDTGLVEEGGSIWIQKAMDDLAQSGATEGETDTLRFILGLEGNFDVAGREVNWDVSYNRGTSESQTNQTQLVETRYREALDVVVNDAGEIVCSSGNPQCVPLNIFGRVTDQDAINYVTTQAFEDAKLTQQIFEVNASTNVMDLPGGPWQVGVGYMAREEKGNYRPDDFLANGRGRTAALSPLSGQFETDEYYIETVLPLVDPDWLPILQAVELEGAYREVDNSIAGSDDTWNVGAQVTLNFGDVAGELTVRANTTEAVRSPALVEAFLPISETFVFADDPCDPRFIDQGMSPETRRATCIAEAQASGANYDPDTFESVIVNASQLGFTGGNENLSNETSEAYSVGFVWRPGFAEGLIWSVDYIDIDLTNAIEELPLEDIMEGCYDGGDLGASACQAFQRDQNFQITTFQQGFVNAGQRILKGYQTDVQWAFTLGSLPGQFSLRGGAWILDEASLSITGEDLDDEKNEIGNADLRANFGLTYMLNDWRFNWQTQYIGESVKDNDDTPRQRDIPGVDDYWMHTLFASYTYNDMAEISLAVRNVFDEEPPIGQNSFDAIGVYDLMGRYITANVRMNF